MAFGSGLSTSSVTELHTEVSDITLASFYMGIDILPSTICAPYREDNTPSVGVFLAGNGRVRFKDFASGDSGSIIDLLMKTWNTTLPATINKIVSDLPLIKKGVQSTILKTTQNVSNSSSGSKIQCTFREWRQYDLDFWKSYGISLPWLEFGDIHPISRVFITKHGQTVSFPAEKYAYSYIERKDGIVTMKIYQPKSTTRKWINSHDSSVWDLWEQLPQTGDKLIITSSRKDALCIWENGGIPSVSLQGEGYIPKEHVVQQLIDRFDKVYVWYDNDFISKINHGRIFGRKMSEKFGLIQIEIPNRYVTKDPSDFCKRYGREKLHELIIQLTQ